MDELIPRIPDEDNEDMMRGWGCDSAAALKASFDGSEEVWTILADGTVVGMFGVSSDGNMWLIRGADIEDIAVQFCRQGGAVVDALIEKYGAVFCFFSVQYTKLLRWMKWIGFDVADLGNGYVRCEKCAR
jgi:hypothetical protein